MNIDPNTPIGRVRLLTGDVEEPYIFDDVIYQHYLDEGLSELETAVEIVNSIIAYLSLQPTRERAGQIEVYQQNLEFLQKRLDDLEDEAKASKGQMPVFINPGQKNWCWLDDLFQNNKE